MIISVSRRTDIPAFYSDWFISRLKEGYALVRNPYRPNLVRKVSLDPAITDIIVFWTKDPLNMMNKLDYMDKAGYKYYFLITVTGYGKELEPNVRGRDAVLKTFKELSGRIGKERTVWRYDPVIMSGDKGEKYHEENFRRISGRLCGYTEKCVISFLDMYKKCERNLRGIKLRIPGEEEMLALAGKLAREAEKNGMTVTACAEKTDFSRAGIAGGKCIDDELASRITGKRIIYKKDRYQRNECLCAESADIGEYNTCPHACLYCYANFSADKVKANIRLRDPESPLLAGRTAGDPVCDTIIKEGFKGGIQ
ncbi:MAG: DUF1848 domain-containing protein [Elusimicrobia bacterium]|nr:DUF1848 domain-containing protein [Elusimicrobiota bacterium]